MRLRPFVTCVVLCIVSSVAAQPNPAPKAKPEPETLPPIFAPRPPPKKTKSVGGSRPLPATPSRRAISPEMAAQLSALATRAAPPASATPPLGAATAPPPAESSDAVQLEAYVVQEERLPDFKERDILTPKGKLELARRRYPGLVGPLSDGVALQMLEEDFARERRRELTDMKGLLEVGGTELPPDVKRKIGDAAMRPSGFLPPIGEPFRTPK